MANFSIDLDSSGPEPALRLAGELDIQWAEAAADAALAVLGPGRGITIDLSGVTFIDSSGLVALVTVKNYAARVGAPVSIHGATPRIIKVATSAGLADYLGLATPGDGPPEDPS